MYYCNTISVHDMSEYYLTLFLFMICLNITVTLFLAPDKLLGPLGYFHNLIILNCVLAKKIVYFYLFLCHIVFI